MAIYVKKTFVVFQFIFIRLAEVLPDLAPPLSFKLSTF